MDKEKALNYYTQPAEQGIPRLSTIAASYTSNVASSKVTLEKP